MFGKNGDRLIEYGAVVQPFNATVEMAEQRGLLSGEHFSVDGTLIQAWASQNSMRRKDGSFDGRPPENWHGKPRINATHEEQPEVAAAQRQCSACAPQLPGPRR